MKDHQSQNRRRLWLRPWTEGPRRIPLGAPHLRQSQLPCIFLVAQLLVLRAGKWRNVTTSASISGSG